MSSAGARGHWSDGETSTLIEAWGQRYLHGNRGSLHVGDWRQVCDAVNSHRAAAGRRFNRSMAQCQWRFYALKSQYKKELAKGQPTPGGRHFAQLRAFLAGPACGPPPGFAAKMPPESVKEEEMVDEDGEEVEEKEEVEEEREDVEEEASGSVGKRTVPAKRHVSSLQDILDRSGGPTKMPATATAKEEEVVKEEVGREGPASVGCSSPAAVVTKLATEMAAVTTKLAEVYERVEMERLSVDKEKMGMEREKRLGGAAKVEAENLGETDDN